MSTLKLRNEFVARSDFRPMLAAKVKPEQMALIEYPVLATPKIDGIRCITREKLVIDLFKKGSVEAVSRTLNTIPNLFIQETLQSYDLPGLDGEILTYTDGKVDPYNDVQSKVMSQAGEPDFNFHVFDLVEPVAYWDRMDWLKNKMIFPDDSVLRKVLPQLLQNEMQLLTYEASCLLNGFEGCMLRSVDGDYKFGRSTFKQGGLLKIKRFEDAEATVIGFEELQHNENEQVASNLSGLTKRSSHSANLAPGSTLGALIAVRPDGVEFNIGSGFTDAQRQDIWDNQDQYKEKLVKYKFQPHGSKDRPRCPIFLGFRDPRDCDIEAKFQTEGDF